MCESCRIKEEYEIKLKDKKLTKTDEADANHAIKLAKYIMKKYNLKVMNKMIKIIIYIKNGNKSIKNAENIILKVKCNKCQFEFQRQLRKFSYLQRKECYHLVSCPKCYPIGVDFLAEVDGVANYIKKYKNRQNNINRKILCYNLKKHSSMATSRSRRINGHYYCNNCYNELK